MKECMGKGEWGNKEPQVLNDLRTKHDITPVLLNLDPNGPIKIETGASKYVCSRIPSQQSQDGK